MTLCTNVPRLPNRAYRRLRRNGIAVVDNPIRRCAHDSGRLHQVEFTDRPPLPADALFFTAAQRPRCELAHRLGCAFNRKGTVVTTLLGETNVPGAFVAGDASHDAQFVVVAASEGAKAGLAINRALQRLELKP